VVFSRIRSGNTGNEERGERKYREAAQLPVIPGVSNRTSLRQTGGVTRVSHPIGRTSGHPAVAARDSEERESGPVPGAMGSVPDALVGAGPIKSAAALAVRGTRGARSFPPDGAVSVDLC